MANEDPKKKIEPVLFQGPARVQGADSISTEYLDTVAKEMLYQQELGTKATPADKAEFIRKVTPDELFKQYLAKGGDLEKLRREAHEYTLKQQGKDKEEPDLALFDRNRDRKIMQATIPADNSAITSNQSDTKLPSATIISAGNKEVVRGIEPGYVKDMVNKIENKADISPMNPATKQTKKVDNASTIQSLGNAETGVSNEHQVVVVQNNGEVIPGITTGNVDEKIKLFDPNYQKKLQSTIDNKLTEVNNILKKSLDNLIETSRDNSKTKDKDWSQLKERLEKLKQPIETQITKTSGDDFAELEKWAADASKTPTPTTPIIPNEHNIEDTKSHQPIYPNLDTTSNVTPSQPLLITDKTSEDDLTKLKQWAADTQQMSGTPINPKTGRPYDPLTQNEKDLIVDLVNVSQKASDDVSKNALKVLKEIVDNRNPTEVQDIIKNSELNMPIGSYTPLGFNKPVTDEQFIKNLNDKEVFEDPKAPEAPKPVYQEIKNILQNKRGGMSR